MICKWWRWVTTRIMLRAIALQRESVTQSMTQYQPGLAMMAPVRPMERATPRVQSLLIQITPSVKEDTFLSIFTRSQRIDLGSRTELMVILSLISIIGSAS